MMTSFGDERKRKINLGGVSSATTPAAILLRVQAERQARAAHKLRSEKAVRIQAWWRGYLEKQSARQAMKRAFEGDVTGLTGLRCLVLIGKDEDVLGMWAAQMVQLGAERILAPALGEHGTSWLVLMRQALLLLLRSVAEAPESLNALSYLQVLTILLSNDLAGNVLGAQGASVCRSITDYLIKHRLYDFLRQAIERIPVASKNSSSLPPLLTLSTLPLSSYPQNSPQHTEIFGNILISILSIPLLPNRLPLTLLPTFISQLPLAHLDRLEPFIPTILHSTTVASKIHLAANLFMFLSPHYKHVPTPALATYLQLSVALFNSFPSLLFELHMGSSAKAGGKNAKAKADPSSNDGRPTRVSVVSSFTAAPALDLTPPPPLVIDDKTKKRLEKIIEPTHILGLITITQSASSAAAARLFPHLVAYLFALTASWPAAQELVINLVLARTSGGLVREIYRDLVRRSPLGKEDSGNVMDPANVPHWPPILFLADLYSQALLTMGDDEFFGKTPAGGSGSGSGSRNPLTLDELVAFSRQLLNIAWTLYWRDSDELAGNKEVLSQAQVQVQEVQGQTQVVTRQQYQEEEEVYIAENVKCSWETVREKVTRCLLGIQTRDSRKPFVPPDHWMVTSHLDMNSFVEAAILEEQQLAASSSDAPTPDPTPVFLPGRALPRRPVPSTSANPSPSMSRHLAVLHAIPFAIPFETRVSIFRHFVMNDVRAHGAEMGYNHFNHGSPFHSNGVFNFNHNPFNPVNMLNGNMDMNPFGMTRRARVVVRRGMVAQDGFDRLGQGEVDLKGPVEIAFVDGFGQEEAGIDGGGVFKEFLTSLCQEVFDTDRGLWLANKKNELYPNPHAYATEPHSLNWYRFIGRILGKAMYEGILVDVGFAGFFLAKWLGRQSFLDDLSSLDPDLYNGLIFLKHYTGNTEDLSLNFTMAVEEFGVNKTVDLIPNGSNVAVTKENRLQYIYLVSHYRLSKQIKQQSQAFFEGLSEMIDQKWLRMFSQQEIQILIGGVNSPIDLDDLRAHTNYGGLYDDDHPTIVAFWKIVNSFDQEQKRSLLRFVTSCSRPPLLGFKELVPNFSIRDAGDDEYRLPTSSTCVNLLKLPLYTTESKLRQKLLQAVNSGAGFDLS